MFAKAGAASAALAIYLLRRFSSGKTQRTGARFYTIARGGGPASSPPSFLLCAFRRWVQQFLSDSHLGLSTDLAVDMARSFLREMAQPTDELEDGGHGLLLDSAALVKLAEQERQGGAATQVDGGPGANDRSKRRRTDRSLA